MTMRVIPTFCAIALLGACAACSRAGAGAVQDSIPDTDWIQLFNGRDLTGWTPKITGYEADELTATTEKAPPRPQNVRRAAMS